MLTGTTEQESASRQPFVLRVMRCGVDRQDVESNEPRWRAQGGEDGGDLGGIVLLDSLQAHVGVEHQGRWLMLLAGAFGAAQVLLPIQAYRGFNDQVHGQRA